MIEHQKVLCGKCGYSDFEYDTYWKEYSCKNCGWMVENDEEISSLNELHNSELIRNRVIKQNVLKLAEDSNDFALTLYEQLRHRSGNVFFSPFSIRTALGMTYAGARGETAAQMGRALGFSFSNDALHVAFKEIIQRLNTGGGGRYEMEVVNSLWGQDGMPLQTGFRDLVARYYGGNMNLVDFRQGTEARMTINQWVENKTRQKIQEPIPVGYLGADTRLVLVNAVYFKGIWELQFDETATCEKPFHLEGGETVQVSLMYQREKVRYMQAGGFQAVDLDYQGGDLSMFVLLPNRNDGRGALEKTISARMIHDCLTQMDVCEVKLFLPRFKISWESDLRAPLTSLGMSLSFKHFQADFSGINGHEPPHEESLFVSSVFHKAFVEVNEEGTEAAALTFIPVGDFCIPSHEPPPIPIFRADHPFLFAIRDRKSSTILFLGRMSDPTQED